MYDTQLTKQSLPAERYRILLGTALSVFSSNNAFVIKNIIRTDNVYSWHNLIDKESEKLVKIIKETIKSDLGIKIAEKFAKIVEMRNRIIHGFRVTSPNSEQIIATKVKNTGEQFLITEEYLTKFISKNDELSSLLHDYRGY